MTGQDIAHSEESELKVVEDESAQGEVDDEKAFQEVVHGYFKKIETSVCL
jgi:hypothetical protein